MQVRGPRNILRRPEQRIRIFCRGNEECGYCQTRTTLVSMRTMDIGSGSQAVSKHGWTGSIRMPCSASTAGKPSRARGKIIRPAKFRDGNHRHFLKPFPASRTQFRTTRSSSMCLSLRNSPSLIFFQTEKIVLISSKRKKRKLGKSQKVLPANSFNRKRILQSESQDLSPTRKKGIFSAV